MKIILLIVSFVALSSASPSIKDQWSIFKRQHGKIYHSPSEENFRISVFLENMKMIEEHNSKYAAGLVSYKMKLNSFADMLPEEVGVLLNGFNRTAHKKNHMLQGIRFMVPANIKLPESVDWRQQGAVTTVKNQGRCGGCWAFSANGALEGQLFRKTGKLVSLSEQQLIDCSEEYGNQGCSGGLMNNAFEYIKDKGGVTSEEDYPYIGSEGHCRRRGLKSVEGTELKALVTILEGSEEDLMAAVATVGPVSAAVSATNSPFMNYGGGIFTGESCEPDELDHAILVVGYGSENGQDFWIVKNSWNTNWGEDGYVRLARNKGNVCGIASMASYPLL